MKVTRALLICHAATIALLIWVLLRESPRDTSSLNEVLAACDDLRRELEDLQSAVRVLTRETPRREVMNRKEIETKASDVTELPLPSLENLAKAVGAMNARIAALSVQLPNLEDIRKVYPTTNWAGWEAYKYRCGVSNETIAASLAEARARQSEPEAKRKIQHALRDPIRLKKSQDILEMFGSPSDIHLHDWGIAWVYRSPSAKEMFVVQFMHGVVSGVRTSLLDLTVLSFYR